MKKLLFVLMIAAAFALVSCGEMAETTTEETETETQVAKANESPVTTCDGNVCTHQVTSSRECAVDGNCPGQQYAKAEAHVCTGDCAKDCPYAKAQGGKCGAGCSCFKGKHVCTDECPADCPLAKAHVCTEDCPKDCPHAKAAGGCQHAAQVKKAEGCGGCPLKQSCKSGT